MAGMNMILRPQDPDYWIAAIFSAKAVQSGGVVRRNRVWVEREIGRDRFEDEVRKRGFHLIEVGQQLAFICNTGKFRVVF
jgi:hypothetical protein